VTRDHAEALRWFTLAAEQEHAEAQYYVGRMYQYGCGVNRDVKEAVKWFRLATEQGHKGAQNNLETIQKSKIEAPIIDTRLLEFIPYFENIDPEKACRWEVGGKWSLEAIGQEGALVMKYPIYEEKFEEFIHVAYDSGIMCGNYQTELNRRVPNWQEIGPNDVIKTADLELVRVILTKLVRVERFCDGAWAGSIKEGAFLGILRRLKELNEASEKK